MHAEMILILIVVLIVSQICLVQWKKWRPHSYHLCTLIGMWIIPLGLSIKNHWWRFPCIWLVFSSVTSLVTNDPWRNQSKEQRPDWSTNGSC